VIIAATGLAYGRILFGHLIDVPDTLTFALSQKFLIRSEWLRCALPSIDPYVLCGTPLLANIAAGPLYALNLFLLVGTPLWGFHLFVFVHYLLAAGCCFLFLRRALGVSSWPAAMGAFAYSAGGVLWSMEFYFFLAAPWVPLYFLGLVSLFRAQGSRDRRRALALGAISLAMLFYCAHLQVAYDALLVSGLLVAAAVWRLLQENERRRAVRVVAATAGTVIVGMLLAAPQLLTTASAAARSYRSEGMPYAEVAEWSFPPARLLEYLVPFLYGAKRGYGRALAYFYPTRLGWVRCVFVGVPLLVFAGSARPERRRWLSVWSIAVLVFGLLLALGRFTPVHRVANVVLPWFSTFRHPEKYVFWVHFGLVVSGVLGVAMLEEDATAFARCLRVCRLYSLLIGGIAALLISVYWLRGSDYAALAHLAGSRWLPKRLFLWQLAQLSGVALALAFLWYVLHKSRAKSDSAAIGPVAFLLTAVHLLALNFTSDWTMPSDWFHNARPAADRLPADARTAYRIYSDTETNVPLRGELRAHAPDVATALGNYVRLTHNTPAMFGIRTVNGFSPIMNSSYISYTNFRERDPRCIMNLLSARYLIVQPNVRADDLPPGTSVLESCADEGYTILQNSLALPRIYVVGRHIMTAKGKEIDTTFEMAGAALPKPARPEAAAPETSGSSAPTQRAPGANGYPPIVVSALPDHFVDTKLLHDNSQVDVSVDEPGRTVVTCRGPTWLVIRDWHLPGWQARLDAQTRVDITEADGGLMAVFVPVGDHEVEFRYRAPGFRPGCILACVGFILLVAPRYGRRSRERRIRPR